MRFLRTEQLNLGRRIPDNNLPANRRGRGNRRALDVIFTVIGARDIISILVFGKVAGSDDKMRHIAKTQIRCTVLILQQSQCANIIITLHFEDSRRGE